MPCTFGTPSPRRTQPWKTRSPKLQGSRGSWGSLSRASSRRTPHGIINWKAPHAWSQESSSTPPPLWGSLDCRVASNVGASGSRRQRVPSWRRRETAFDRELLLRKKYACGFLSRTFQLSLRRHWKMHFPGEKCAILFTGDIACIMHCTTDTLGEAHSNKRCATSSPSVNCPLVHTRGL